jgi:hypothetical protein
MSQIKPFSGSRYQDNIEKCKQGEVSCALCGKPVKDKTSDDRWKFVVRVVDGGGRFGTEDEFFDRVPIEGSDMGFFPVGAACAKKLKASGVFVGHGIPMLEENYKVADFDTIEALIEHSKGEGATHVSTGDGIKVYFPIGSGAYQEAVAYQKEGYWHLPEAHHRNEDKGLPPGVEPIESFRFYGKAGRRREGAALRRSGSSRLREGEDMRQLGVTHAQEQIESDYFRDWVSEQLLEGEKMRRNDPSSVIPFDANVIARNMLQQLVWDTKRDLRINEVVGRYVSREEANEFMSGFEEEVKSKATQKWLADEIRQQKPRERKIGSGMREANRCGPDSSRERQPGGTRIAMENDHARVQRMIAFFAKHEHLGEYVPNSAIPIGDGKWSFYVRLPNGRNLKMNVSHAALTQAYQSHGVSEMREDWQPGGTNIAMEAVSKPGKHGTLHLYLLRYKDKDDNASPTFTWKAWAYSAEHALDRFNNSNDDGWEVLSWERVQDGSQHRATRHNLRETNMTEAPRRADHSDIEKRIHSVGGRFHFEDRSKRNSPESRVGPRWTAYVTVFGHDISGNGNTKAEALAQAIDNLPTHLRRHNLRDGNRIMMTSRRKPRFPHRHEDALVTDPALLPSALAERYEQEFRAHKMRVKVVDSHTEMPSNWDFANTTEFTFNDRYFAIHLNVAKGEVSGHLRGVNQGGGAHIWSTSRAATADQVIRELVSEAARMLRSDPE